MTLVFQVRLTEDEAKSLVKNPSTLLTLDLMMTSTAELLRRHSDKDVEKEIVWPPGFDSQTIPKIL